MYAEFYNPDDAEQPLALMSASAGKQTFRIFNSNVRLILKADAQRLSLASRYTNVALKHIVMFPTKSYSISTDVQD